VTGLPTAAIPLAIVALMLALLGASAWMRSTSTGDRLTPEQLEALRRRTERRA
jgi:hypothetical protein